MENSDSHEYVDKNTLNTAIVRFFRKPKVSGMEFQRFRTLFSTVNLQMSSFNYNYINQFIAKNQICVEPPVLGT